MNVSRSILTVICSLLVAQPMRAQVGQVRDPGQAYSAREALQGLLDRLDNYTNSSAYSAYLRARTREQADLIRTRLVEGDFQLGDRIVLAVEEQEALSDTFTVDQGPGLTLPTIGDIPLEGVLRSELKDHVSTQLRRFLREPIVQARALIRIGVLGGVAQPGFYTVSGEALISDAVMIAGGPTADAKINEVRVEREGVSVWEERSLQAAMVDGRTLDQLNLRAGDHIIVPQILGGLGAAQGALRSLAIILALPVAIVTLVAIF